MADIVIRCKCVEDLELLAVDMRELFGNVAWDRATAAWCNASELELDIKFTDRLAECNTNKRKTNEERWHVMPFDGGGGGSTLSTVSWGGWTLALIDVIIGTNEPSIAPTTLAKPHKTLH